ncbi:MAG: hypothetical protein V7609_1633 [Verrucomicrobiota bacterium]
MKFFPSLAGLTLLVSASLLILSATPVSAQSPPIRTIPPIRPIPPLPAPTIAPAVVIAAAQPLTASIAFANATEIKTRASSSGRFQLVGINPREVVDIAVDFPASLPSTSITAQSLDGGKIVGPPKDVGKGVGATSIRFQAGDQPGLYRVLITGARSRSILQFWVADPKNPMNKRPVINPGH